MGSTLIAACGFAAYTHPRSAWAFDGPAKFVQLSNGHQPAFFGNSVVPIHGTEGESTASVIGCTYVAASSPLLIDTAVAMGLKFTSVLPRLPLL